MVKAFIVGAIIIAQYDEERSDDMVVKDTSEDNPTLREVQNRDDNKLENDKRMKRKEMELTKTMVDSLSRMKEDMKYKKDTTNNEKRVNANNAIMKQKVRLIILNNIYDH